MTITRHLNTVNEKFTHYYLAQEIQCSYSSNRLARLLTHLLACLFVDAELDFPVGALTQLPTDLEPARNMSMT